MKTLISNLLLLLFLVGTTLAQPAEKYIKVNVVPDHADWLYKTGDKVKFTISVTKNGANLKDVSIRYSISEDMMPSIKDETLILKNGSTVIDAGTMKSPGFLRCLVYAKYEGKEYEGRATAGFDRDKIQPVTELPSDFNSFWEDAKKQAGAVPMDVKLTLLPDRCTEKVNVYMVNIQNYRPGSRLYGILCVPVAPGKYPAILKVPGAGIRPYQGDVNQAGKGVITLDIGIHGIPVNLPNEFYNNLQAGALNNYQVFNLDNKNEYYYKRVYMGCVRAIDYIFSLSQFDGKNLAVTGGSQGGALSIITAALDSRVSCLVSFYPALCDLGGYVYGRAGGWPHMFRGADKKNTLTALELENSRYYDVVNFARNVKVPGFYSLGYNDMVCPPTSTLSAYNVINSEKELMVVEEIAHWTYPEQWEKAWEWVFAQFGK